jgi:FAD/FMN-containing dehydrogenase
MHADEERGLSRRQLLAGTAGVAAAAWLPTFETEEAAFGAAPRPKRFPAGIRLYRQGFQNWSTAITVDAVWTCAPRDAAEVVAVVNWAHRAGYRVRPRGHMHNWSPLTLPRSGASGGRTLLVDTTAHLTSMRIASTAPATVRVQAGASMESLLGFLEQHGYGMAATPAPGDITVGGALAIDGHGTAVPAAGERRTPGQTFGSLSNLIVWLTVVAWSARKRRYVLRRIPRDAPAAKAFLTHVGRAFVVEVALRVGADANLRCVSLVDVPASELFAAPGTPGHPRTFASYLDAAGRAEAIWFPFTERPWLKVWSVAPTRPAGSTAVTSPYNYPFAEGISLSTSRQLDANTVRTPSSTPSLGALSLSTVEAGLKTGGRADLWGASKNLLLYVRPATLRVTANGYAILTRRRDVQRVISDFVAQYRSLIAAYRARGQYPASGPLEIRVTGLDDPAHVGVPGAQAPTLSAVAPRADHPEWDVAVWLDVLTFPDTPHANAFMRDVEQWVLRTYVAPYAAVRPEWSKGWAYSSSAPWSNRTVLRTTIPAAYRAGRTRRNDWDWTRATLDAADPHRVFSNTFLDVLLPS